MTAPIAPVAAPPAVQRTLNETIAKVTQATTIPPPPVAGTPRVVFQRDPVKPDAPPSAELAAGTAPSAAPTDTVPPPTEAPTAPVADVVAPEPTAPAGEFSLDGGEVTLAAQRNAEGQFINTIDPTIKYDFVVKSNLETDRNSPDFGKPKRYSKTIPELARMAKDAIVLHKKQSEILPEVDYYRQNVPKWQEAATQSTTKLATLEREHADMVALNRELLTAPDDIVIQHRENYANEQSPAKQAERSRAALETERQRLANERQGMQAQSFIQSRLAPAIQDANTVLGEDTVTGMIARASQPLLDERGQIPPTRWYELEAFVNGPLKQRVTEARSKQEKERADAASRDAAVKAAQASAQRAVNDAGRATVPVGSAAPDRAPTPPAPKSVKEAINKLINAPLPTTI